MISLKSVLLLLQFGIDVYIPHREYQVKPHSFSWFSGDCDAAVVHSGKGDGGGGAAKISYATKTKELITFGELLIVLSTKVNLLYLLNSTDRRSSAFDKAKLFAKNLSKNSNFDDSGISLPAFPSRTNLKLHNISVTPKIVKKVITNLDSSKASGPGCILMVVLKNCESELS